MITGWGEPEPAVLSQAETLLSENRDGSIATLVNVEGSAYRRPGAKLVVPADGDGTGAITSGCLENEIGRIIESVTETGRPRLEAFNLQLDEDTVGLEIGCDGRVEILVEPLDESYSTAVSAFASRDPGALLTVIAGTTDEMVGNRGWFQEEFGFEEVRGAWPQWLRERGTETARRLAKNGGAETIRVDGPRGTVRVFIDGIIPPPQLLVIGSGNDVFPLVSIGARSGFDVGVVGYRPGRVGEEDLPDGVSLRSTSPRHLRDVVEIGKDTYCVVMTHDFIDDQVTIAELLQTQSPYIGVVSSRRRTANLIEAIERNGSDLGTTDQDRIYGPIGLDLGGGSPSQIALSIVSEVLAVYNEREPGHLRDRNEPIHDRAN